MCEIGSFRCISCMNNMIILQAAQPELIALEKAVKEALVPAGTAREVSVYTTVMLVLHV